MFISKCCKISKYLWPVCIFRHRYSQIHTEHRNMQTNADNVNHCVCVWYKRQMQYSLNVCHHSSNFKTWKFRENNSLKPRNFPIVAIKWRCIYSHFTQKLQTNQKREMTQNPVLNWSVRMVCMLFDISASHLNWRQK